MKLKLLYGFIFGFVGFLVLIPISAPGFAWLGLVMIGFYYNSAGDFLRSGDFSPFAFGAVSLLWIIGAVVAWVAIVVRGVKYAKKIQNELTPEARHKKVRVHTTLFSILIFLLIAIGAIGNINEGKQRAFNEKQGVLHNLIQEKVQKLESVIATNSSPKGFDVVVQTGGGLSGKYEFDLRIWGSHEFFHKKESLYLNESEEQIVTPIKYSDLFNVCLGELQNIDYCTAKEIDVSYNVDARLRLLEDDSGLSSQYSGATILGETRKSHPSSVRVIFTREKGNLSVKQAWIF